MLAKFYSEYCAVPLRSRCCFLFLQFSQIVIFPVRFSNVLEGRINPATFVVVQKLLDIFKASLFTQNLSHIVVKVEHEMFDCLWDLLVHREHVSDVGLTEPRQVAATTMFLQSFLSLD